jgi:hypothetical protein
MRQLVFFLSLACLPATAALAAPFAVYDPANGDIVFREVRGLWRLELGSDLKMLNDNIEAAPFDVTPIGSAPPSIDGSAGGADWVMEPAGPFNFDTLRVRGAVQPLHPLSELTFSYLAAASPPRLFGPIVEIPEPSAFAIAATSLVGLSLMRRRSR